MEMMELDGHPFYVAVQFHPEYLSRPLKPSPPFLGFILASCNKLQSYLHRGCRLSPRELSDDDSDDDSVLPLKLAEKLNKSTRSSEDEAVNSEPVEGKVGQNIANVRQRGVKTSAVTQSPQRDP
uniref:CTP synthase (glutamine hydrolyzing) n=1 Tax=Timema genevievae TaxID=629358 RepID=A0A7R9K981_TIMGE|nr:unnamed protein product [Timema genevievae]